MPLPALLAFLANPAFWKGAAEVGASFASSKAGGGGQAGAPGATGQQIPQFQTAKAPASLMGFPSMQNTNYGDIIAKMLSKYKTTG
jgi:hypothetical protein